jgi:hypothetical protein
MRFHTISCLLAVIAAGQIAVAASPTQITDPEAFVKEIYAKLAAPHYEPPTDIYTPRLKALFVADEKRAKGEVGCLEFMFWVNGQDYKLKNVVITSRPVSGHDDRRTIVATFSNLGTANEIHFDFQRVGDKWLLDDARSTNKSNPWTLSKLLKCSA